MRKLVLILLALFAVVNFIRAFDDSAGMYSGNPRAAEALEMPGETETLSPADFRPVPRRAQAASESLHNLSQ